MSEPLIDQNRKNVSLFAALNLIMGYAVLVGLPTDQSVMDAAQLVLKSATFMSVMGIVAVVIGGTVSPRIKARIVSFGKDPLPGFRAFTEKMLEDDRIDVKALKRNMKITGAFPKDPVRQNKVWFNIYKLHAAKPSVLQAHKSFLLMMEMAVISLLAILIVGMWALKDYFFMDHSETKRIYQLPHFWLYGVLLIVQFFVIANAARTYGINMVRNVLAEESAR